MLNRDDLKEKVARALTEAMGEPADTRSRKMDPATAQWVVGLLWRENLPLAEAALSAIEGAGMVVVPVDTLRELVAEEVYNAYHAGIEIDGQWMDGGRSEGEWLRDQLGLDDGHHDKSAVWDALPGLVERRVSAMVEAGRIR